VGAAPRVLVVAGDAVEAPACELALETGLPGGSAVTIERSAVAGLSAARTGAFDVVVAGTDLPDGHELDVVRSLAAEPDSPPVIAMLGVGSERLAAQFGEQVVHAILREAGEAVAGSVRGYDLAARVGPQGFGVLLPGADRAEAEVAAQRIRASVAAIEFPAVGRVTMSLRLAAFPEAVDAVPTLLEAAEQALLIGRRSGDAVVAAPARKTDEPPAGRW